MGKPSTILEGQKAESENARECDRQTVVECSPDVLEETRRLAVAGLTAFAHGGRETGGVLYGTRAGRSIRVVRAVEVPCEHALGPRFILSDHDQAALEQSMKAPAGLEVVGWFRAHTRGGLELDADDGALFQRHFPAANTAALILKPVHWGPASAAWYVRGSDGQTGPVEPRAFDIQADTPSTAEPAPAPLAAETNGRPRLDKAGTGSGGNRWWWLAAAAAMACLAGAFLYGSRSTSQLGLTARVTEPGTVRIEWDRNSRAAMRANLGVLEIRDGDAVSSIPLEGERIRSSSVTYEPKTDHILVSLKLTGQTGGNTIESVEFESAIPPVLSTSTTPSERPTETVPRQPERVAEPPAASPATKPVKNKPAPAPPPPPTRRAEVEAESRAPNQIAQPALPPPPAMDTAPSWQVAMPEILTNPGVHGNPPPREKPPANTPVYTGARSGRFIWTGLLDRRGIIEMEGPRVNRGSVTGVFPAVPLFLRVLPAEFSRDGLTVFTAEQGKDGMREGPSKANGWNGTHFKFDLARAHELVVLEAPNRTNDYTRLVVRNDGRECSVVVVDWTVVQP